MIHIAIGTVAVPTLRISGRVGTARIGGCYSFNSFMS